jgi:hypothetical protein
MSDLTSPSPFAATLSELTMQENEEVIAVDVLRAETMPFVVSFHIYLHLFLHLSSTYLCNQSFFMYSTVPVHISPTISSTILTHKFSPTKFHRAFPTLITSFSLRALSPHKWYDCKTQSVGKKWAGILNWSPFHVFPLSLVVIDPFAPPIPRCVFLYAMEALSRITVVLIQAVVKSVLVL